ncbi:zinc/iron-chelating domain-containing protein [Paucibacter sp. KBW04]|uniref:YkgJ family cysteine cluster protein n=1 Tax=Paucibacter sp. KBW04 TaxID=2153361 RepID=UPI000F56DD9B|nr:YkgJ family cysteine cluster protein [Paucibacter sp. KBW04]RQO63298.1 zinc/iron-chelating domain-containing protein [Paucibacter sp. KBW04]
MTLPRPLDLNPCQQCGACCAHFRVSFYWADAPDLAPQLIEKLTPHLGCMRGSNQARPRCQALSGAIGEQVACTVYAQRPSPCKEVQAGDEKCIKARAAHSLPALGLG